MINRLLYVSIALLLLGGFAFFLLIQRLGGWRYTLHRIRHTETGLYLHRKQLFEQLPERPGAIVFAGDSQTEQCEWAELLNVGNTPVLNRGITGDHTAGVLARLPEILRHRPSKIFLMIGVNDLLFGHTASETAARYRELVAQIRRQSPETQLVLLGLPGVNNKVRQTGLNSAEIVALNTEIAQIAQAYALPFIDLYPKTSDAEGQLSASLTADGLHLNAAAYLIWKQAIAAFL